MIPKISVASTSIWMYRPTSPILWLIGIWDIRITQKKNNFSKDNFTDIDIEIPISFWTYQKKTFHIYPTQYLLYIWLSKNQYLFWLCSWNHQIPGIGSVMKWWGSIVINYLIKFKILNSNNMSILIKSRFPLQIRTSISNILLLVQWGDYKEFKQI